MRITGTKFFLVETPRETGAISEHVLIRIDQSRTDPTEALATLEMVRDSVITGGVKRSGPGPPSD